MRNKEQQIQLVQLQNRLEKWYEAMAEHAGSIEDGGPGGKLEFEVQGYVEVGDDNAPRRELVVVVHETTEEPF